MKKTSGKKVFSVLLKSWLYTILGLSAMILILLLITIVFRRFGAQRIMFTSFLIVFGLNTLLFFLSELLVVKIYNAKRIENDDKYKVLVEDIRKLCKKRWMIRVPRLYILDMNSANACAFGWGILGQYGIGFTQELLDKLDRNEISAVAAHELAHIMHLDVGINTSLSLSSNFAALLGIRILRSGGIFAGPLGWIFFALLWITSKVISLLLLLISQERELAADALGSWYVGNPDYLITGLKKISKGKVSFDKKESFLKDVMISHPKMDERFESLESLKI